MSAEALVPELFVPEAASRADYVAFAAFMATIYAERDPDLPPPAVEELIQDWQHTPAHQRNTMWAVWSPDRTQWVARARTLRFETGDNPHLVQMHLEVLPAYRRRGLARALLALVAAEMETEGRTLLLVLTHDAVPAGEAFMRRLGATPALEQRVNQLDLAALDRGLLQRWLAIGEVRGDTYELGFWDGPYPEEEIEAIAAMGNVMNQAPVDDLDVEDVVITPQILREAEKNIFARGIERRSCYVRHRGDGAYAGYSETYWSPHQPAILQQGDTAVVPEHRGQGLGRWLKAAMLARVLEERPQVARVRTGNAGSNAAMLRINHELGFKLHRAQWVWQVALETVLAYLSAPPR